MAANKNIYKYTSPPPKNLFFNAMQNKPCLATLNHPLHSQTSTQPTTHPVISHSTDVQGGGGGGVSDSCQGLVLLSLFHPTPPPPPRHPSCVRKRGGRRPQSASHGDDPRVGAVVVAGGGAKHGPAAGLLGALFSWAGRKRAIKMLLLVLVGNA